MRQRLKELERSYSILDALERKLGGARTLSEYNGRRDCPRRGVYFFREVGEERCDTGTGPRIVRVGTHALTATSRTTFWDRLSQHRGNQANGSGNHRGAIFRLLVGTALIARDPRVMPQDPSGQDREFTDLAKSAFDMWQRLSQQHNWQLT